MIPLTLRMKNFLSYRGETPVFDFTAIHIACLSGDNGAGKSSFLEAMHWALWGEARLGEREIITIGEQEMYVELTFMVNDISYRVNRSFTTNRGGTKLLLEQASDPQRSKWISINGGTLRETQQRITTNIMGMSYSVFQNSAYLRQGRADAFTQLTPSERRDILAQILEIDQYEHYRERTKVARTTRNDEKINLQGQMAHDEKKAAEIPEYESLLNHADARLAAAESYGAYADTCIALQKAQQIFAQTQVQYDSVTARHQNAQASMSQLTSQLAQRPLIEAQYHQLVAYEQTARQLTSQRDQYDTLQQQHQATTQRITTAQQQLVHHIQRLNDEIQFIDGALVNYDNLVDNQAQLIAQIATLHDVNAQINDCKELQLQLRETLTALQSQLHQQVTLSGKVQELTARISQLDTATQHWDTLNAQSAACDAAQQQIATIQSTLMTLQSQRASLSTQRDDVKTRGLALTEKQKALTVDQPCPTCHTMMDHDHYTHAVAEFEREIVLLRNHFSEFRDQITHINQHIATLENEKLQYEQQSAQASDIRRQLGKLEAQRNERDNIALQLALYQEQLASSEALDLATTIKTTQQQLNQCEEVLNNATKQQSERQFMQQRIDQLHHDITQLTIQKQRREDCLQERDVAQHQLDTQHYALDEQQTLAQLRDAITMLDYDPTALRTIQHHIDQLSDIRTQYNQLAVDQANLDATQLLLGETTQRLSELDTIRTMSTAEVNTHTAQRNTLEPHIGDRNLQQTPQQMRTEADLAIRNCHGHRSQLLEKLSQAREAQNKLIEQQARLAILASEINRYDILEKAFASKGIQAMLISEYAIPALEHETNQILARMSDNQLYLAISTKTETQRGTTIETIDLRVSDASGTRPIEAYSGGEAFRISFALRIALSKLLTHRAGHRLETLIIDEGFGTQDAQGRERLVEAINSISDEFHTILVITHIQELRDLFPTQIAFKRTVAGSSWEVVA
ncbi:MAG: SMC family ATPase [Chloroflexia bacterium]|nr:SMC family ATPase [Chloroflexia bacterium]